MSPEIGQAAPAFSLTNAESETISLKDFAGKWLVFYFYPKDDTPGCTIEAVDFTALKDEFAALNAAIVGVSPDNEVSHQKFIEKQKLGIELLSDPDHKAAEAYGAWQMKNFMGKENMGIVRSTFLIAPDGAIAHTWPKVSAKEHAQAVLDQLRESAIKA
ncbi:MAG: thioredoxin-dependent thiol peroxidase [Limnothrix sp.]